MSNDISVDCETLAIAFDAPVIAIGARAFDRTTGKLGAKFYIEIELASAIKSGRVNGGTIAWWITKSPRAKTLFDEEREKTKSSLATALVEFSHWCIGQGKDTNQQSGQLFAWGNGASQDITWLEHAYTVGGHGLAIPWIFRNARDLRTIVDAATDISGFNDNSVNFVGTEHNAVDDATHQAKLISAAYKALMEYNPKQRQAAALKTITKDDDDEL